MKIALASFVFAVLSKVEYVKDWSWTYLAKDEENQKKDEENREMRAELERLRAQVAPAEACRRCKDGKDGKDGKD